MLRAKLELLGVQTLRKFVLSATTRDSASNAHLR